ncbi:unnamed protein product [Dibothriocephalus latus]|uniref:Methionyl/Leucyl tRNA synthetase domain-containing protein n=1 Tax=Dibothriocephalus latus TaxID=60516 RepID=A0A3P7M841_DIBLA|nr:unnamed protein product [Dibothriocephalus latus]
MEVCLTPVLVRHPSPHIGHAYTLCIADAWARYTRLRGHPCTQAFASPSTALLRPPTDDQVSSTNVLLSTGVDEYGSKKRLETGGFFYWNKFSGWYCATDEAFYADWELEDADKTGKKVAKASGNAVEWIEEETCRFSLKQFKPDLHRWLDSGGSYAAAANFCPFSPLVHHFNATVANNTNASL